MLLLNKNQLFSTNKEIWQQCSENQKKVRNKKGKNNRCKMSSTISLLKEVILMPSAMPSPSELRDVGKWRHQLKTFQLTANGR